MVNGRNLSASCNLISYVQSVTLTFFYTQNW